MGQKPIEGSNPSLSAKTNQNYSKQGTAYGRSWFSGVLLDDNQSAGTSGCLTLSERTEAGRSEHSDSLTGGMCDHYPSGSSSLGAESESDSPMVGAKFFCLDARPTVNVPLGIPILRHTERLGV